MSPVETIEVSTRHELNEFARTFGVRPHIAAETWDTLIYLAEVERGIGGRLRCLYRERLARELALRRRKQTFIIVLVHEAGSARCHHVREVLLGLSATSEAEAERQALMIAVAQVDLERRAVCGAMVRNLVPYATNCLVIWSFSPEPRR